MERAGTRACEKDILFVNSLTIRGRNRSVEHRLPQTRYPALFLSGHDSPRDHIGTSGRLVRNSGDGVSADVAADDTRVEDPPFSAGLVFYGLRAANLGPNRAESVVFRDPLPNVTVLDRITPLSGVIASRLEKAAVDNGFDDVLPQGFQSGRGNGSPVRARSVRWAP